MNPVQPKAVLFVDDEKSYVELMTQLLSDHLNCPIHGYTRPQDALADLPRLDVAMIVTDYSMPVMNGIAFVASAKARCPRLNAVMITGHQIELAGADFSQVPGLREMLFKPVTWRQLAQRIIQHWPDDNPPTLRADGAPR